MSDIGNMLLLLVLCAAAVLWLKLTSARERAMGEARRECERRGLQLLDESVGLRAIRLRRIEGLRRLERGYSFDFSIHGDDREQGRLWMIGSTVSGFSLPASEPPSAESIVTAAPAKASGNVVQLHPGRRPPDEPFH